MTEYGRALAREHAGKALAAAGLQRTRKGNRKRQNGKRDNRASTAVTLGSTGPLAGRFAPGVSRGTAGADDWGPDGQADMGGPCAMHCPPGCEGAE
jgi:hypothetical protein